MVSSYDEPGTSTLILRLGCRRVPAIKWFDFLVIAGSQRSFDVGLPRHPFDLVFAIKCIELVVANFDILRNVTSTSTSAIDATSKEGNLRPRPRWRSIPDTLRVSRGPLRRTGPAPTSLSHGAFVLLVGFGLPRDSRLFPIRLHLNPNDPVNLST
ncbi:hypothetical protein ACFE04_020914 [Oxalis oulophora]